MMLNAMHFMRHSHIQVGLWMRPLVYGQHRLHTPQMAIDTNGMSLLAIG
jgi:hypothetical protein